MTPSYLLKNDHFTYSAIESLVCDMLVIVVYIKQLHYITGTCIVSLSLFFFSGGWGVGRSCLDFEGLCMHTHT